MIKVISGDKDGAGLRREKARTRYYVRCDGTRDDEQLNEAVQSVGKTGGLFVSVEDWERIFG